MSGRIGGSDGRLVSISFAFWRVARGLVCLSVNKSGENFSVTVTRVSLDRSTMGGRWWMDWLLVRQTVCGCKRGVGVGLVS